LYTSFREDVWWWEITTTIRKILIVAVGVFGESMGPMQVHATAFFIVIIMLVTAIVQPYNEKILQVVELGVLASIWMTLWAGSVFNSHPRCEDGKGGTIGWCNVLSIFIGVLNVLSLAMVILVVIYYKKQKQFDGLFYRCCGIQNDNEDDEEDEEDEENEEVEDNGDAALSIAIENSMNQSYANPALDADVVSKTQELSIEMTTPSSVAKKISTTNEDKLPVGWESHKSDGMIFYVKTSTGLTQWNHPSKKHHKTTSTGMPPDWDKYRSDAHDKNYYVHKSTGLTQCKFIIFSYSYIINN